MFGCSLLLKANFEFKKLFMNKIKAYKVCGRLLKSVTIWPGQNNTLTNRFASFRDYIR